MKHVASALRNAPASGSVGVDARSTLKQEQMHVVIAGGGVAALEAAIALRDLAGDRVDITMLAPGGGLRLQAALGGRAVRARRRAARAAEEVRARPGCRARAGRARLGLARLASAPHGRAATSSATTSSLSRPARRREEPFEHATTFRGQEDSEKLHGLIQDLEGQYARRIAFVVPTGVTWSLPLYELALMAARRAYEMSLDDVELTFVTPEERPLAVFGPGPERRRPRAARAGRHHGPLLRARGGPAQGHRRPASGRRGDRLRPRRHARAASRQRDPARCRTTRRASCRSTTTAA